MLQNRYISAFEINYLWLIFFLILQILQDVFIICTGFYNFLCFQRLKRVRVLKR